jgi:hypothetical protein
MKTGFIAINYFYPEVIIQAFILFEKRITVFSENSNCAKRALFRKAELKQ